MQTALRHAARLGLLALLFAVLAAPAAAQTRPEYADLPLDPSFGPPSGPGTSFSLLSNDYWGSVRGADGSYYIAGHTRFGDVQTRHNQAALTHFLPDGRLDSTFGGGTQGFAYFDPFGNRDTRLKGLGMQRDGKLVAVGEGDQRLFLMRFRSDGTRDVSFGPDGYFLSADRPMAFALAGLTVLPDDRIVVPTSGFELWWFSADGRLDSTQREPWNRGVTPGAPENFYLNSPLTVLPGGKMLVLANDNDVVKELNLARLNADGTRDLTFGAANGYTRLEGTSLSPLGLGRGPGIRVDGDGRIYVYGTQDGALMVARFSADGRLDPAFDTDGIATFDVSTGEDAAHTLLLLPDGRVLAGGRAGYANGASSLLLVMFNADGTRDATFGQDGVASPRHLLGGFNWIGGLHVDPDGRLVASMRYGSSGFNVLGDRPQLARYLTSLPVPVAAEDEATVPQSVALHAAYPNPFNPSTTLAYTLPAAAYVRLSVHDLLGREVAVLVDALQPAGAHTAVFAAAGLASGVYLYHLEAGTEIRTRRVVLMK